MRENMWFGDPDFSEISKNSESTWFCDPDRKEIRETIVAQIVPTFVKTCDLADPEGKGLRKFSSPRIL